MRDSGGWNYTEVVSSVGMNVCVQGDADFLRYHGLQLFDSAMNSLEEKFGVCFLQLSSLLMFWQFVYIYIDIDK